MKLLMITAIEAFQKDIKFLLKKSSIITFSYTNVKGFRDLTEESVGDNWFASEMNDSQSLIFYAFVKKENAAMEEVTQCSVGCFTLSWKRKFFEYLRSSFF